MKGDQMGILAADPTQRELPLSNQTRFKSLLSRGERLDQSVIPSILRTGRRPHHHPFTSRRSSRALPCAKRPPARPGSFYDPPRTFPRRQSPVGSCLAAFETALYLRPF